MTEIFDRIKARTFEDELGCWIWTGPRNRDGYGQVSLGKGKNRLTHRVMLAEHLGRDLPSGWALQVDHLCRNRACCNPDHLELVPARINNRRGASGGKTHCHRGHELTPENTQIRYQGTDRHRSCRECIRLRKRLAREARRGN